MTQFEQENDLGGGGGEVDDETMDEAWQTAADRRSTANIDDDAAGLRDDGDEAWAKLANGDADDDEDE